MYHKLSTISETSVSSVTLQNLFTENYDVYEFHIPNISASTGAEELRFKFFDSTNTIISDAEYYQTYQYYNSVNETWTYNNAPAVTTEGNLGYYGGSPKGTGIEFKVFNPYNSSLFTTTYGNSTGWGGIGLTYMRYYQTATTHLVAERITGIYIIGRDGETFNNIDINVYGVK